MQDRHKTAIFLDENSSHTIDPTTSGKEIELAVEEDLRQAKIKLDLAQAKAKANVLLHELESAAVQAQLEKDLKEAKLRMHQEHMQVRYNLAALSFLKRLDASNSGQYRIAQDAATVFLLDKMEGYQRPGGARAISEDDLIKPEEIFNPSKTSVKK